MKKYLFTIQEANQIYRLHLYKKAIDNFYQQFQKNLFIFDNKGVLMVKQHNPHYPTFVYNPVGIANYALFRYNDLLRDTNVFDVKTDPMSAVIEQLEWLIKNRIDEKDMSIWYFNYPIKSHGCKPPWKSGMAQGLILSLLLRIYNLTKNKNYIELAERVANSMKTPTDEGGFLYINNEGDYWYQEYMGNCGYVLNGFIYAMWGIYDYYLYFKDRKCKTIFDKGIITLKHNLENYKVKNRLIRWTVYDLKDRSICDLYYHSLHCFLLKKLYEITNEKVLLDYHNKWSGYLKQPNPFFVSKYNLGLAALRKLRKELHER